MAYDNLEDDILLLHGLDDKGRGVSDVGQERDDTDALDVFADALTGMSGGRSMLDDLGNPGVGLSDNGFRKDYTEMSEQEIAEDREKFVGLMKQMSSALREGDSLGYMDDVSIQVVKEAASKTWSQLTELGEAAKKKLIKSIKKITKFVTKGNRAKRKAEEKDREMRSTLENWKGIHKSNRRKWRASRNAVARMSGELGAFGGVATQIDSLLNKRGKLLKKFGNMYNQLHKQRRLKTSRFDALTEDIRRSFKKLPGIGDLSISPGMVARWVAVAGLIAGIAVVLVKIYQSFDKLTGKSSKEVDKEKEVDKKIEEIVENLEGDWAKDTKTVHYDPDTMEPYQEIRENGNIVALRYHDKILTRDVDTETRDYTEEYEERESKRVTEKDEGMLSQMAVPLVVGGVAIAGLYVMTREEGRATIQELRTPPPEADEEAEEPIESSPMSFLKRE